MKKLKIRDLISGSSMFIAGGFLGQFLSAKPDFSLAAYAAIMQLGIVLYLWYRLKDTLEL